MGAAVPQYRVIGECATFTSDTPTGRMRVTFFRNALVPPAATPAEIRHHLSVGLISAVGGSAPVRVKAASSSDPEPVVTGVGVVAAPATTADAPPELSEERLAAQAKLPADGSLPHHNASKAVWVEAAVARGYAYEAAAEAEKPELVKLLKG